LQQQNLPAQAVELYGEAAWTESWDVDLTP